MAESGRDPQGQGPQGPAGSGAGAGPEEIPLGQRLFDNWLLLLLACVAVMFVFYTGWGLVEMASLPQAPLP